jgi:hypothetical protein
MELDSVQKPVPEVLEFEKNVIEPKTEAFKFGNNLAKPEPKEPSHKF